MSKGIMVLLGVAAVVVLVLGWVVAGYNGLVTSREGVDAQWSQVENQYQRRFDLIPNLVESVKGSLNQEQEVFTAIAEARTRYSGASSVSDRAEAAGEVESALSRLLVIVENYPELKSSERVADLMSQLEGTENRVAVERGRYNEAARDYNSQVKMFPMNILAGMFNFEQFEYFESATGADQAPAVDLSN